MPACLALHRTIENIVNVWSKKQKTQEDDKRTIRRFQDKNMTNLTKISRTAETYHLLKGYQCHACKPQQHKLSQKREQTLHYETICVNKKTAHITKQIMFNLLHMPWSIKLSSACSLQSIMDAMSSIFRKQTQASLPRLHGSWLLFNLKPTTVIRQSYLGHIFKRDPL